MISSFRYHFLVTVVSCTLIRPPPSKPSTFTRHNISSTLDALEKLLQYFDANRGSLIVDSMWGIRMIQGKIFLYLYYEL